METLTFIHGVFTVVGVLTVVGMVWVIQKIIDLKERLRAVSGELEALERELNIRVDGDIVEVEKTIDSMYRDMDSRFDKFENRISKKLLTD